MIAAATVGLCRGRSAAGRGHHAPLLPGLARRRWRAAAPGGVPGLGEAPDGEEAIAAVAELSPEVVRMDIDMPKLNGIEATREIRARWPRVLVIGLSVPADAATADSMRAAGAATLLSKSACTGRMLEAILETPVPAPEARRLNSRRTAAGVKLAPRQRRRRAAAHTRKPTAPG